jgi:hypothetical protein
VTVARIGPRIVLALLVAVLIPVLFTSGVRKGNIDMKTAAFAAERPPIDRAVPAMLETATLGLG